MSMNLETRQQQICTQFKLLTNKMSQDVNLAFSQDQSVLIFWNSAQLLHVCSAADRSNIPRPVCASSSWTSEEAYETSHNPNSYRLIFSTDNNRRISWHMCDKNGRHSIRWLNERCFKYMDNNCIVRMNPTVLLDSCAFVQVVLNIYC